MTKNTVAAIALGVALFAIPFAAFASSPEPADSPASADFEAHVTWMESNWDAMSVAMESGNWEAMHALMESAPSMEMGSMMGGMGSAGMMDSAGMGSMGSAGMGGMGSEGAGDHDSHHGASRGMGDVGSTGMGGMNW